jgi:putative Holliday junction resolvase
MKLIGIDFGRRRIGLAVSDETGTCVRGLPTLLQNDDRDATAALAGIIAREKAEGVVVGVPLDPDERETALSLEIRKFAADLEKRTALPVYFIDESLTSKQASELLLFRKKKDRRDKAAVDRMAACLILESFLREKKCENTDGSSSLP